MEGGESGMFGEVRLMQALAPAMGSIIFGWHEIRFFNITGGEILIAKRQVKSSQVNRESFVRKE